MGVRGRSDGPALTDIRSRLRPNHHINLEPRLTDLDDGNMKMTTDFRRVYAPMIDEWLGVAGTAAILKGRFEPLGAFV